MPKQTIVWANEYEDEGYPPEYDNLYYADDWSVQDNPTVRPATLDNTTLEQIADFCDRNAESRGNRNFPGAHRLLAALLHKMVQRDQAGRIMWEIAAMGGLDYMNGVGPRSTPAFADFGITDYSKDWQLPA